LVDALLPKTPSGQPHARGTGLATATMSVTYIEQSDLMCDKLVICQSQVILKLESHRYQLIDARHLTEMSCLKRNKVIGEGVLTIWTCTMARYEQGTLYGSTIPSSELLPRITRSTPRCSADFGNISANPVLIIYRCRHERKSPVVNDAKVNSYPRSLGMVMY